MACGSADADRAVSLGRSDRRGSHRPGQGLEDGRGRVKRKQDVGARTQAGAGHVRRGESCQDALGWNTADLSVCLAVADGHGSPSSFRSAIGARLAVETAIATMQDFLRMFADSSRSMIKRNAAEQLPRAIARAWGERVHDHREKAPFTEAELARLDDSAAKKVRDDPMRAYGSTFLVAGVNAEAITYLHIGDGDILAVSATGEVVRPIARDERSFADETASLCLPDAWRDFRVGFQPAAGREKSTLFGSAGTDLLSSGISPIPPRPRNSRSCKSSLRSVLPPSDFSGPSISWPATAIASSVI